MDIVTAWGASHGVSINILGTSETPFFQANQVGALIGVNNVRESIKNFDVDKKVLLSSSTHTGTRKLQFLTMAGLRHFVSASRKPNAIDLARLLGMEMFDSKVATFEATTLSHIMKAFHGEQMRMQYAIGGFFIDLYFPRIKLAIECDEQQHTDDKDAARQQYIETHLGCTFLRFKPHAPGFCVFKVINQIHQHILTWDGPARQLKDITSARVQEPDEMARSSPSVAPDLSSGREVSASPLAAECTTLRREGWTAEQKLEKIRIQMAPATLAALSTTLAALPAALASITDMESRINAEKAFLEALRCLLRPLALGKESPDVDSSEDDGDPIDVTESGVESSASAPAPAPAPAPTPAPTHAYASTSASAPDSPSSSTVTMQPDTAADVHLFPPQPKRKLGRPAKPKVPPATTADTPLQRFLDECFETSADGKTYVAYVKARHRLWRGCHVGREETSAMVDFFKQRFQTVQEMDEGHNMTCSFYKGLTMKPWVPDVVTGIAVQPDVDAFVREACEVHVMGRVRKPDLWNAFVAWKRQQDARYEPPAKGPTGRPSKEEDLFFSHLQKTFVYHTGVDVKLDGEGASGLYGLYLATASKECREVGYNRSPNTHASVLKLDARGNVVATIDSQDAFAHDVVKKSSHHVCKELTKCFKDGMRGLMPGDGYAYMRAKDHAAMLAARKQVDDVRGAN